MNIRTLPTHVMLTLTQGWLDDSQLREAISAHPLGAAAYGNLRDTAAELARLHGLRNHIAKELAGLSELLQQHDSDFDRFVRALYYHLTALVEAAATPELAHQYRELRDFLFPQGLSLVQRSYMAESGATVEIEESITPAQLTTLHSTRVGDHTLGDLYHGWIDAGRALGKRELERMRLQASMRRQNPTQPGTKDTRYKWIRAVRMVIDAMDTMALASETRNQFLAPMLKCIADTQRGSESPQPDSGDGDIDSGDIDPGDVDSDVDGDIDGDIDPDDIDGGDIDALGPELDLAAVELDTAIQPSPEN